MAILISQKNTLGTATPTNAALTVYTFNAAAAANSTARNVFYGLSDTAETLNYSGGTLKVADVSNGDIFNITDIAQTDALVLSLAGNNVVITNSTTSKTYTLGAFIAGEAATVTFGNGEIGAKSINIKNAAGVYTYGYAGEANTTHAFSSAPDLTLDVTASTAPSLTTVSLPNTSTVAVTHIAAESKIYLVNNSLLVTSQATNLATLETLYGSKINSVVPSAAVDTSTTVSLAGLDDGVYSAYTLDVAGNWTVASTNKVTVDTTAPLLVNTTATAMGITVGGGSSPLDGATGVLVSSNIVLSFSENVVAGTGNIVITQTGGATDVKTIDITDNTQVTISGSTITINPTTDLLGGGAYDIQIPNTAIKDGAGNVYAGIANATTLNFATTTNGTQAAPVLVETAGDDIINGNQGGAASVSPVAFTATNGNDIYVISEKANANISITGFSANDVLRFDTASGTALTGTPSLAYNASDTTISYNNDGIVWDIILVGVGDGSATTIAGLMTQSTGTASYF
jgi:hypothetical protein